MSIQSFNVHGKFYFKQGCLPVALRELAEVYHVSRVLIRTDEEMLHNGRLTPITGALYDMGIAYAMHKESEAADCVIFFTGNVRAADWDSVPDGAIRIVIPPSMYTSVCRACCLNADMVILDEDLIPDEPAALMRNRILTHAWSALTGGNASEYTLSWAVHAMRTVFSGATGKTQLLHADWLAFLAFMTAKDGGEMLTMTEDACEALGMTMEELTAKIREVSDEEQQYAATHFTKQ